MFTGVVRRRVPVLLTALLIAACGQESPHLEQFDVTEAPSTDSPGWLPGWLLETFPPSPDGAVLASADLAENAITHQQYDAEERMPEEEGGTLLGRTVRLTYGKGSAAEVKEVIDHYRVVLREAGWEITFEEELDPEEQPSVSYPGKRLGYDVDGHRGTVTASQHEDHVRIILSVYESQPDRAPYSTYPPLIDLPGWYDVLPEPPEQIRRARVEVWYREAPTTFYWIEYLEYSLTGQQGDVDSVADHYRGLLGQSGWQIFEEKRHSEEDELPHTIHRHEEVVFDIAGHGVTGKISVSQSSWQEGQWTPASVTVTIDG